MLMIFAARNDVNAVAALDGDLGDDMSRRAEAEDAQLPRRPQIAALQLKRCNLRPAGKLGIFGFGSSAHIITQIAIERGHGVYVVSRSENHQHLATQLGATWTGPDAAKIPTPLDAAILFAPAGSLV